MSTKGNLNKIFCSIQDKQSEAKLILGDVHVQFIFMEQLGKHASDNELHQL